MTDNEPDTELDNGDDDIVVIAVDRDLSEEWDEPGLRTGGPGGDPPRDLGFGGDDDEGGPFGDDWLWTLALYAAGFAIGLALAAAYSAGKALREVRVGGGDA